MNHWRHQICENKHTEIKYLSNTRKDRIPKAKNKLLEFEKDFKPIKRSIDDMDAFE